MPRRRDRGWTRNDPFRFDEGMDPERRAEVISLHERATAAAQEAAAARDGDDEERARAALEEAFELESGAVELLRDEFDEQPLRASVFRAAAGLALELGDVDQARELAEAGLAEAPPEIAAELEELAARARDVDVDQLIRDLTAKLSRGNGAAEHQLIPLVYEELHRIAGILLRRGRMTLQPTELVNEFYLKYFPGNRVKDKHHLLCLASRVMRQILIDHARRKETDKRPHARDRIGLDEVVTSYELRSFRLVELDAALEELAKIDSVAAELVNLRFFGGRTQREASEILGIPLRSLDRTWRWARAWLRDHLGGEGESE